LRLATESDLEWVPDMICGVALAEVGEVVLSWLPSLLGI
jgi:hypothetical protein